MMESCVPHINAHITAGLLAFHGVKEIVACPGSRNAPLIQALHEHGGFVRRSLVDERSAAFFALGTAEATRRLAALICTSGTALLNFAPALAEAYYRQIPLIVISADRPASVIDRNEAQTMRQPGALRNVVKKCVNIPDGDNSEAYIGMCRSLIEEAFDCALTAPQGPVHINIQLSRPLISRPVPFLFPEIPGTVTVSPEEKFSRERITSLGDRLAGKKVLLIAGSLFPDHKLLRAVRAFVSLPDAICIAEYDSNLHGDGILRGTELISAYQFSDDRLRPDVIITMGGSVISSGLKQWLAKTDCAEHWSLGNYPVWPDTFGRLAVNVRGSESGFLSGLYQNLKRRDLPASGFHAAWTEAYLKATGIFRKKSGCAEWSDFKGCAALLNVVPSNTNLFISNGTCIRYAEFMPSLAAHAVYANRGVSGIDGTTSTAIGIAASTRTPLILLTGDMSLRYDIGALAIPYIPASMKIVVINNRGGGIFRGVSTTMHLDTLEDAFAVEQDTRIPLRNICEGYGWNYFRAENEEALMEVIPRFFASREKALLEIVADPAISAVQFRNLYKSK